MKANRLTKSDGVAYSIAASSSSKETVAKLEAINKFNIVFHIASTNQFVSLDHGRGTRPPESGSE
jgi:hypothetical protein